MPFLELLIQGIAYGELSNEVISDANLFLSRTMSKVITIFLLTFWTVLVHALPIKNDSLRFEILLTGKMLNDIHLNEKFVNSIDITSNRLVLLSTSNQFYVLGWGGIVPLGEKVAGNIGSYAFTADSLLMTIRNNELCSFDSLGNLSKLFKLPGEGMKISAGKNVMYVYDNNKDHQKNSLYIIAKGGKYAKLFEVTTPIYSVVEVNDLILFATENAVFRFNPKNNELKELVALSKDKEIKSIAVDSSSNRIYFSTEKAIYALKDSNMVTITDKFGGILRYFNDGLIVFNPEKNLLIRMVGIDDKITSEIQALKATANDKPTTKMLTNSTIINMVKTKLSDDLIVNIINKSMVNFNMSVDSMIFLSNQNVSSAVIMAMKNAMKRKTIDKNFYIIAGSYPTEQQANDAVADLKGKGFTDAEVVGKNSYGSYRIAYKGYATNEEAAKDLTKIKQTINPSAWVFEKKLSN